MEPHKYLTQISQADLKELSAMTNIEAGWLMRIERAGGKIQIGIDPNALAYAINGFYRNGGCSASSANCTSISFEPPS